VSLDLSVLFFAILLTGAVAVVIGLMAATLAVRRDAMRSLRTAGGGGSPLAGRLRAGLTVSQIVASFALLAGALLLAVSYRGMAHADLGFDGEGVTAMTVALSWDRVGSLEERTRLTRELLAQLRASPAVEEAAMINSLPLSGSRQISRVAVAGRTEPGREPAMAIRGVSPNYHRFLRIGLVEGRLFEATDLSEPDVALVNRRAAELLWPGESPVGTRVEVSGRTYTLVGVTENVLHEGPGGNVLPELYIPYPNEELTSKSFLVRSSSTSTLDGALRGALRSVDPAQPVREIRTMEAWAAARTAPMRFLTGLMAVAAAVATLLAGVGVFGAMAGVVRERRGEIALRMAIGANPTSVIALMARRVALLVLPGLLGGSVLALLLGDVLAGVLVGVDEGGPAIIGAVALALTAVSLVSAVVPTARARAVQPMQLLRED
jgi:predicted permease